MNKIKVFIAYGIWSVFTIAMMFILADEKDSRFIASIAFVVIAIIATVVTQLTKAGYKNERGNLKMAPIVIANGYLVVESIVAIIICLLINSTSLKVILAAQLIILVISGLIYMGSISGNEHIAKVESRQKSHKNEL